MLIDILVFISVVVVLGFIGFIIFKLGEKDSPTRDPRCRGGHDF